jgi:hypothetical protein
MPLSLVAQSIIPIRGAIILRCTYYACDSRIPGITRNSVSERFYVFTFLPRNDEFSSTIPA